MAAASPPGLQLWPGRVLALRQQFPRWGKDKLVILLAGAAPSLHFEGSPR